MSAPWKLRGYVIERLLGSGGSSDVWQARVASTGAPVALKRLVVPDALQARRAHAEAAMLTVLDHPHLVRLHGLVPDDGAVVLVLDLADGGSLADLLAARGRLTPGEVITAVAPIAAASAYTHGQGVIHGDVTPANVLFTARGVPLLADLGVARLTGDDADAESTPAYVDPSVAAGYVPGPATDVFMLGGVALHALTGAPPWPEPTAEAALASARQGALDDVAGRLARAGVSERMTAVVCRALAIEPERRGTAADFALDLRHSGQPVAVELAAGLARRDPMPRTPPASGARSGPRHAAALGPTDSQPPIEWRRISDTPFNAPAPTSAMSPRPRPVIPPPKRRRRPQRRLVVMGAGFGGAALAAGTLLWVRADSAAEPAARASGPAHVRASASSTSTSPAPSSATSPNWPAALAALDTVRAKAFATRDVRLLRRVYVPGPLLSADTALLTRIVPPGCGLVGARTHYADVHVSVRGDTVQVSARASLPPSTLVCRGSPPRRAEAAGPATLRLELIHTAAGLRIAVQQVT
jgi:serine/threonine protein kinase